MASLEKGNVFASDTGAFDMLNSIDDLVYQTNLCYVWQVRPSSAYTLVQGR